MGEIKHGLGTEENKDTSINNSKFFTGGRPLNVMHGPFLTCESIQDYPGLNVNNTQPTMYHIESAEKKMKEKKITHTEWH